ncbi:MAG: cyclomaltodextrinase N-terminal domain-containing protein [Chitinophagaceae bacterium]|nr:cyclomaltodextrinase N-terminal domain-containing protein [Chitinophagaceae bacterium]
MIRLFSVFAFFLTIQCSFAQINVYPSHWWIGMKSSSLQLMIHSNENLGQKVSLKQTGLVIKKIFQPENKHYLFVDLEILPTAKPGRFVFSFSDGKSFSYELKLRQKNPSTHQGVRSEDLIYLIMPDRFVNGDPTNDSFKDLRDTISERKNPFARHGGDLAGVESKLDYLKDAGVTSIWMTPVMENDMPIMNENVWKMSGYHGYWITSHYNVDKRLGGNEAYKKLVQTAHQKGLKVIQDAVYNHIGNHHHTVLDLPMKEWLNQWPVYTGPDHREEVFFDPYASSAEKNRMIGGWFVPHLPDLNLSNPYVAKYMIQQNIWSTEEFGIDGWRVDTYKYCDEQFLNDINAALIREFPQLTVFGESWTNSVAGAAYFTQNNLNAPFKHQIKGVTDFPLQAAIMDVLNQPFGWNQGIMKVYSTLAQDFLYKDPFTNCIFLDNHDMNRFFSMAGENLNKYKIGLGLLLTTRGIPQVYYGTEIAMKNFMDPNDAAVRLDFPGGWKLDNADKFSSNGRSPIEQEAFDFFKSIANFRKGSAALTKGKLVQFIPKNGVYVYFRISDKQKIMCVVNSSNKEEKINLSTFNEITSQNKILLDVLNRQTKNIDQNPIAIPPVSFQIFELK